SRDGKVLFATSRGRTIKVWNTETWQERAAIEDKTIGNQQLAVSPDGKFLAIAGNALDDTGKQDMSKGYLVRLWHISGNLSRATWHVENAVSDVAFSSDGKHLAAGSMKTTFWNIDRIEEEAIISRSRSMSTDRIGFSA